MSKSTAYILLEQFYKYFNLADFEAYRSILAEDFIHQINFENLGTGIEPFIHFLQHNNKHFEETIDNTIIMVSEDGSSASTKFQVSGKYILTDDSGIDAHGQTYRLEAINFFEIKNEKISSGYGWYDQTDRERQVKKA